MSPLDTILNWFTSQPRTIQLDFVTIASHFHLDREIELEFDYDSKIEKFKTYITDTNLSSNEKVQRTLFLKSLIDLALSGRDTEEGWEKAHFLNETFNAKIVAEGGDEFEAYQRFMAEYEDRKNTWIDWADQWKELLKSSLSPKEIADWYFSQPLRRS